MDRERQIEVSLSTMMLALREIARRHDCEYLDVREEERPRPCPCPRCIAEAALDQVDGSWRYLGARPGRLKTDVRERRIVEAWMEQVKDRELGLILSEKNEEAIHPSSRDWYVATSVVQWLVTNVGREVLRKAGWSYNLDEADRKEREAKERQR